MAEHTITVDEGPRNRFAWFCSCGRYGPLGQLGDSRADVQAAGESHAAYSRELEASLNHTAE